MSRIRTLMKSRGSNKLLVPFLTAGYPNFRGMPGLIRAAIDAGSDILELGMPFSDPMADGPDIQHSSHVALQKGANLDKIFDLVCSVRKFSDMPIVLMGYFNPVHARRLERFVSNAREAGVDGFIIPDLPVEESGEFRRLVKSADLSAIFLAAPTTSVSRLAMIERACTDFVYAVTVTGVTGVAGVTEVGSTASPTKKFGSATDNYLKGLRHQFSKPFVAGFGVSSPADAARLCRHADGVVIGSALVRAVRETIGDRQAAKKINRLLAQIRQAI